MKGAYVPFFVTERLYISHMQIRRAATYLSADSGPLKRTFFLLYVALFTVLQKGDFVEERPLPDGARQRMRERERCIYFSKMEIKDIISVKESLK